MTLVAAELGEKLLSIFGVSGGRLVRLRGLRSRLCVSGDPDRKHDRYQRIVGNVWVNGEDVGLLQVRAGLAWWYRDYAREQTPSDRKLYEAAELDARHLRLGLWRDDDPLEPKLKRRASRSN